MTRINSHIPPRKLTDEHLLAEHREIKRIPWLILSKGVVKNRIPPEFCLGSGHVLFFLDKMQFLYNRYLELYTECLNRGFNVQDYSQNFLNVQDKSLWNNWEETEESNNLIISRIITRITESPKPYFHYKKESISKEQAIELLYM